MSITIPKRKNDQHRERHISVLARSGKVICLVLITERLIASLPSRDANRRIVKTKKHERFHDDLSISYPTALDSIREFVAPFVTRGYIVALLVPVIFNYTHHFPQPFRWVIFCINLYTSTFKISLSLCTDLHPTLIQKSIHCNNLVPLWLYRFLFIIYQIWWKYNTSSRNIFGNGF